MLFIGKLIPKTLLMRFMLIITIPTILGQLLLIFLFYDRHWYNVSYYTGNVIANEIKLFVGDYALGKYPEAKGEYLNISYHYDKELKNKPKQKRLSEELEIFKNILANKIDKSTFVIQQKDRLIKIHISFNGGIILLSFSSKILVNPTAYIFILSLISLTIVLLGVSLFFSRKQIKAIIELARAAAAYGRNQPYDYKPFGAKEVRLVGLAFLQMKERLEQQIAKRTRMLAMISHDLRTPLTRMKLQLALMDEGSPDRAELSLDVQSMHQMINSYLEFVRGEGGEEYKIIDITSWLYYLKAKWPKKVSYIKPSLSLIVKIKTLSLERAIGNLISNADKFASKVLVELKPIDKHLLITISDNGIGIKEEERSLVFKAFYRSETYRPLNDLGNVGLGLTIAKEIIEAQNGTIKLSDSKDLGGLCVQITLPLVNEVS